MEKSVSILKPAFLFYRILIRLYFRNDNLVDILFLCTLGFRQWFWFFCFLDYCVSRLREGADRNDSYAADHNNSNYGSCNDYYKIFSVRRISVKKTSDTEIYWVPRQGSACGGVCNACCLLPQKCWNSFRNSRIARADSNYSCCSPSPLEETDAPFNCRRHGLLYAPCSVCV